MSNPPNKNARIANPKSKYSIYLLNFIKPSVAYVVALLAG
jgi:hypothetical protein